MTSEFTTHKLANGTRLQSGIPTKPALLTLQRANGLMLRGVVTATYVMDTGGHPALEDKAAGPPTAVYCDVLIYSQRPNQRWNFFPRVMVAQDRGSMHTGHVWKPRATTMDVAGGTLDPGSFAGTPIENLDGDHVLVGFLEDNLTLPIILAGIPHPQRDLGNDSKDPGHRMKLKVADGDPDFWKHKGAFYGIADSGDFVVDTTQAYPGDLAATGKEPDPPKDGTSGNYVVQLQKGGVLHVQVDGGETLKVELKDGDTKLTLGDGAKHVAIVEALKDLYSSLKGKLDSFDSHMHQAGLLVAPPGVAGGPVTGTSGAPISTISAPSWDSGIESTKVAIPNG